MPEIIESPFRLTSDDPVLSRADGVASTWSDLWTYQVPIGVSLILKPEHTFVANLEWDTTTCGNSTCMVKIEKRDASGSDVVRVFYDMYYAVKEWQDKSKMAHLQVPPEGVIVNERELLVISGYESAGAIQAGAAGDVSYFELRIAKVRKALGT